MPRIRTFKPEFFRSPDTAKASHAGRILFMAMWSWADDEGIGETNLYGLLGFAFPDEDELTVKEIQRLLAEIGGSFGVVFYGCRGRFYYSIPSWDDHQKTERRAHGRHPKPDNQDSYPDLRFGTSYGTQGNSADPQCGSVLGTGEQGNRGTGVVGATEVSHQGSDDVAPPRKCLRHENTPNPPDCGGCASARREYDAWKLTTERAALDELDRKRTAKAAAAEAQKYCVHCDEDGWLLGDDGTPAEPAVKCTVHHEEQAHA